jgi:hypothetical protein
MPHPARSKMKNASKLIPLMACLAALGGCPKPAVYTNESFEVANSPYQLKVDDQLPTACESARRSLLGQGYLIEKAGDDAVKGRKGYKSSGNLSTFIEMNVTCVPDYEGSTLYANGVLSTYDLKKSSSAASVGLSAVGSISLPIGQSADSMVKVAEETINDKAFYGRFFAAVDYTLRDLRKRRTPEEPIPPAQPAPAIPIEQGPVATAAVPQAPVNQPAISSDPPPTAPEPAPVESAQPPEQMPAQSAQPPEPMPVQSAQPPATSVEAPGLGVMVTEPAPVAGTNTPPAITAAPVPVAQPVQSQPAPVPVAAPAQPDPSPTTAPATIEPVMAAPETTDAPEREPEPEPEPATTTLPDSAPIVEPVAAQPAPAETIVPSAPVVEMVAEPAAAEPPASVEAVPASTDPAPVAVDTAPAAIEPAATEAEPATAAPVLKDGKPWKSKKKRGAEPAAETAPVENAPSPPQPAEDAPQSPVTTPSGS